MPSQHSYFHIRCRGQVVRQRSAKPSLPSSNLGGTSTSLRTAYRSQRLFMLRMKSHFSLIPSQLLPKSQSLTLDCDFVFLIWQLIHSVLKTHSEMTFGCQMIAQARSSRQQRSFFVQNRNHFVGLRFCCSNLIIDP